MNKWNILLLALVLSVVAFPAWGVDPPTVLGVLEVRGLDNLAAAVFELTKAAGQPLAKEAASLTMYGALGSMPGLGISPYEKVRALWLAGESEKGNGIILVPVENEGADYLAGLEQAGWTKESETADGILHYEAPPGAQMMWSEVYFLKNGATLVAGRTADGVRQAANALPTLPPILPVEGDIAIQLHPAALVAEFGTQITDQLTRAYRLQPAAAMPTAAMGDLYARGYLAAARQVDAFALGLGVADGNLNLHARVAPVAGTTFQKWLGTVGSPAAAASVVNLPGALMAETMHLGDLNLLAPAYFRYMKALFKVLPQAMSAEAIQSYLEAAEAYWKLLGQDFGIALLPPTSENPLRFAEYVALKDPSAARTLTAELVKSVNAMFQAFSGGETPLPIRIELARGEPRDYREIAVDRLTYRLTPGDEIKAFWPKSLPTELDLEIAWVPGGMLACLGEPALTEALVDRALDGVVSPVSDLPSWKAFYPKPEGNLMDLSHVALFDTLRAYVELYDAKTGSQHAPYVSAGPGSIDSLSYLGAGGLMTRFRFSLADIGAAARKIQESREKAMAAMLEQMQLQDDFSFEVEEDFEESGAEEFEHWSPEQDQEPVEEAPAPVESE